MNSDPGKTPREVDLTYKFDIRARRAIFFAKYEASLRNTDSVTHHITISDLEAGIARETRKKTRPRGKP